MASPNSLSTPLLLSQHTGYHGEDSEAAGVSVVVAAAKDDCPSASVQREHDPFLKTTCQSSNSAISNYSESTQHLAGFLPKCGNRFEKHNIGGWSASPFILGNNFGERLAYSGISLNLVVYLTKVLRQGNASAANTVTNWAGTCNVSTFIGAFLADAYLGRFWTIAILSVVYFIGLVLLAISASLRSSISPACSEQDDMCKQVSSFQLGFFYIALYLIALGSGAIKPCVSSFGADQYDDNITPERKNKSSFFNWFYFSTNVGGLISSSILVYIQDNVSWALGFTIPALAMGLALVCFFAGSPFYRHKKPGGSPLIRVAQVLVANARKWHLRSPVDTIELFELQDKKFSIQGSPKLQHTNELRFLDKAAIIVKSDGNLEMQRNPWLLCTVTQVEEVKMIVRILPIWASCIVYSTVYSQMMTFFVEQGTNMDSEVGGFFKVPAASLIIFNIVIILIFIPLYDRFLVPFVRQYTGSEQGFTQLQRIGVGLFFSMVSMVVAAMVEIWRLKVSKQNKVTMNSTNAAQLSIFWQIPQYCLIGVGEVFTSIGQLEFFYDQSPDAMRSLSAALSQSTMALGSYFSSIMVTIVTSITQGGDSAGWIPDNLNKGHLDYFFWLLAVLSGLNIVFFLPCALRYRYKKREINSGNE
ncbi:hypothetical protein O6H91_08G026300 [Diphasiastrum complanatum]|uniref:Uncharacterized protein n=1 Tax=Diphasiastrum complanatum TaxID=34168 RepID=A0ACC2CVU7_DIPCM|nr:hypothetical protein O6H91_08G026300 [Diphasiastrum complanatum]